MDILISGVGSIPQLFPAVGAVEKIGKHILFSVFRLGCPASGIPDQLLHLLKRFSVDDRLMHILENDPVFHRVLQTCFILEGLGVGFDVDHIPAIFLLCKNLGNCRFAPFIWVLLRFLSAAVKTLLLPVGHGNHNLFFLKGTRDRFIALSLQAHTENTTHYICCLRVDDPFLFVLRCFAVSIGRLRKRLTQVSPDAVSGSHLAADVTCVHLVHDISERRQFVFTFVAVHQIIDRNEPHIPIWEVAVGIIADRHIVSAQAGQVFDHDGGHEAHVYIIQHGLKSGAVEVCACLSVIHIESCVAQPHFFCPLGQEPLLICYGIAVTVCAVISGKATVQGGDAGLLFLFRLHVIPPLRQPNAHIPSEFYHPLPALSNLSYCRKSCAQ